LQAATLDLRMKDVERFAENLQERERKFAEAQRLWQQQTGSNIGEKPYFARFRTKNH